MKKIMFTLGKVTIATALVSVVMMLILAFIMLKFDVGAKAENIFVVMIYIVSTFVGGLIIGKVMNNKKFLWGMGCGILYFAVVLVLSIAVKNVESISAVDASIALISCLAGGTLGGMAG